MRRRREAGERAALGIGKGAVGGRLKSASQKTPHGRRVGGGNIARAAQAALAAGRFFGEQVAAIGAGAAQTTATRDAQTLGRALVGFHFRHRLFLFLNLVVVGCGFGVGRCFGVGAGGFGFFALALQRRKQHNQAFSFERRGLLDRGQIRQIVAHPIHHSLAQALVDDFASAKPQRGLDAVAFAGEAASVSQLDAVIGVADGEPKLDFLDFDLFLSRPRLVLFFALPIFQFAVIQNFANRRVGGVRDFDQIKSGCARAAHRFGKGDDLGLRAVFGDQSHLAGDDLVVGSQVVCFDDDVGWSPAAAAALSVVGCAIKRAALQGAL